MMEQIVVKTEVQSNGEILLYYVDENGDNHEGVLTTIENIENDAVQLHQDSSYMLETYEDLVDDPPIQASVEEIQDPWSEDDTKRLLIFYNDNKTSFVSGSTQKRHLWAVACKTMLLGKNQDTCEEKLSELKTKYCEVRGYISKGVYVKWPFLDMCHQAFYDDASVIAALNINDINMQVEVETETTPKIAVLRQDVTKEQDSILSIKQINPKVPDEKVERMLNTYLKYKDSFQKEHWRRDLWERIAAEMGEDDSEYLQKRFLNHKQHYITMLMKRNESGSSTITWPYMELFDKIFADDASFHKKYFNKAPDVVVNNVVPEHEWDNTQKTILAKYYFDCYEEFQDETIPNRFLWTEVGRLIDKKPETCQTRYEMLRREHLEGYINGVHNLQERIPISIIFDLIIVQDVSALLSKTVETLDDNWSTDQVDDLVQFFFDNIELFKDQESHFVCWAAIAHKLKSSVELCKQKWDELVIIYKSILENKKEDPDLQIDWRYIELFDRIFDYGMDTELLKGYDVSKEQLSDTVAKVTVKKVNIKTDQITEETVKEIPKETAKKPVDDHEQTPEARTDPRSTKILEHYLKNKDKFQHARNKLSLWDPLAKQIGINSTQIAHRFRTLKQTYIDHVKKEIDTPRIPITWPYYALSKKVFGYRLIKNKLKQGQLDTDKDDWLAREIKLLISFFSKNFNEISDNTDDVSIWAPLASELGKTMSNCKEKFVELRKCYRKLKTMRARNPDVKISWSYFNMFDRIYTSREGQMQVETLDEGLLVMDEMEVEEPGDDDYQCIIVLQEGQELPENSEVIDDSELLKQLSSLPQLNENITYPLSLPKTTKWTKRSKKRLLILYINYIRSHRGKEINPKDMWGRISTKLNKTPGNCRKMLAKMKNTFQTADEIVKKNSPFTFLLEKVVKLKPKLEKSKRLEKTYKDVAMASEKVELALRYFLEHIEEFVNPIYEKKYLWNQLASHILEPVNKVYNKINYLKQAYDIETEEINGNKTEFSELLKEIITREVAVRVILDDNPNPDYSDDQNSWTDDGVEVLMNWYLGNLDKFKNPKFNRSYLWMEVSSILRRSPLSCSKKMSEIRTQYRNMVKLNVEGLKEWRFFELCQKIYGTGKKSTIDGH